MVKKSKNYQQAKDRVEKKIGFMIHAGIYVVVNAGLITLNLTRSPEKYWFVWPLGGLGDRCFIPRDQSIWSWQCRELERKNDRERAIKARSVKFFSRKETG